MTGKILVTGATGFVGQNLISYLQEKESKTVEPFNRESLNNIHDLSLEDADIIVHLAGKAHDLKKTADPDEYYRVNFELTKKLYDAFLVSSAKKFIFISSVKAAADTVTGVLDENYIPDPVTDYGKSKLMAEEYIASQPLPEDKAYYILRPCMIHGEGNKGNLNLLYKIVEKGIPYPLAGFINKRSFLSVENLCFVINELISKSNISPGIYNIADDVPLSTNEVVRIMSLSLNKQPKLWKISPSLIKGLALIGDKLHLPLTTERLTKLTESYIVSNKKIKEAINHQLPLSSEEGLRLTALSFRKS